MFVTCAAIILVLHGCVARIRSNADTNWQKLLALGTEIICFIAQGVALVYFVNDCSNLIPDKRHDDSGNSIAFAYGYLMQILFKRNVFHVHLLHYSGNSSSFILLLAVRRGPTSQFCFLSFAGARGPNSYCDLKQVGCQGVPSVMSRVRDACSCAPFHAHSRRRQWLLVPRLLPQGRCDGWWRWLQQQYYQQVIPSSNLFYQNSIGRKGPSYPLIFAAVCLQGIIKLSVFSISFFFFFFHWLSRLPLEMATIETTRRGGQEQPPGLFETTTAVLTKVVTYMARERNARSGQPIIGWIQRYFASGSVN